MTDRSPDTTSPRATRRRLPVLATGLLLTAVGASAAASAALSEEPPTPLETQMRDEIDAMVDAGMSPDDPKVQMLEDALDGLEAGADRDAPPEPGVDVGALLEESRAAEAAEDARVQTRGDDPSAAAPAWDSGAVMCEVVPGLLDAGEIAGAQCASVPQPDGTSRYVAIGADGVARVVVFGHDGDVRRADDVPLGAPVAAGAALTPTPQGGLVVTPPGGAAVDVDLRGQR
jgi:hypothetical protein